ncbi:MAG: fumarate reductase [Pseudonocardia sp. SCN 72-86]|nr:MAG: fumarate reductase [Pseudonocardia sp. SCN 72-86]
MSADGPDLVVAGAGGGLAAALRGAELGLDVLVVEASEQFRRGNNTSMSTAMIPGAGSRFQAEAGIEDSARRFHDDIMAKTKGSADAFLAATLATVSAPLVEWLHDYVELPIELVTDFQYPGHSRLRCHTIPGRHGSGLLDFLVQRVREDDRIDLLTPARLVDVRTGDNGVTAAVVEDPSGRREEIPAPAVLLATNGFGADPELVRRYLPEIADAVYHGSETSRGDALAIGGRLDAATAFLDAYQGHGALAARGATLVGWATVMLGGIIVDTDGHRFGDETTGYSEYAATIATRPGATAWIVLDKHIHDACLVFTDFRQTVDSGALVWADTATELARRIDVPAEYLVEEVEAHARAASTDEPDRFGRTTARELNGPLAAVRVVPALFHTQGGLVVDEHARVLTRAGSAIEGLYAAGGAAAGISGHGAAGYLAGNGLLPALGLSYLAAEHIAAHHAARH